MSGLIGRKIGMTSIFTNDGAYQGCTVIEAGPCIVTQVKSVEKEGYKALQLAFADKKDKHTPAAMKGHFKKTNTPPKAKVVEFRHFEEEKKEGDSITVEMFKEGEFVEITGTSKGKGFQGVVKRHGFSGVGHANKSHGQHDRERAPGSLGNSSTAARVMKGMRMGGRMGGKRVSTQNLKVLKVLPEKNLLIVKGSVAGSDGSYVIIQK